MGILFGSLLNHVVLRILYDLKAKSRGAKDFERYIVLLRGNVRNIALMFHLMFLASR